MNGTKHGDTHHCGHACRELAEPVLYQKIALMYRQTKVGTKFNTEFCSGLGITIVKVWYGLDAILLTLSFVRNNV